MKKFVTVVSTLLIAALCSSTLAFAAYNKSLGAWMVSDKNGTVLLDASAATIVGDSSVAYVVAVSEEINSENLYFLFSTEYRDLIQLELVDTSVDDDSNTLGLFKVNSRYDLTGSEIAQNADSYLGEAIFQYFDSHTEIEESSDMINSYQQEAVKVIDHSGRYMKLDHVPENTVDGAAVVTKSGSFLGFYREDVEGDFNILSADLIVRCFPLLKNYYAATNAVRENPTQENTVTENRQPAAAEGITEARTGENEGKSPTAKEKTEAKTEKASDKADRSIMKDGLGMILVIAGAVILVAAIVIIVKSIAKKEKSSSSADRPQSKPSDWATDIYQPKDDPRERLEKERYYGDDAPTQYLAGSHSPGTPQTRTAAAPSYGSVSKHNAFEAAEATLNHPAGPYRDEKTQSLYTEAAGATLNHPAGPYRDEETQSLYTEAAGATLNHPAGSYRNEETQSLYTEAAGATLNHPAGSYRDEETQSLYTEAAEATQSQEPICLIGKGGHFNGQVIQQAGTIVIGRHPLRCTLVYPQDENGISTVHCQLNRRGNNDIEITDLASKYGTFINGKQITPNVPAVLKPGDTFSLSRPTNSFVVQ